MTLIKQIQNIASNRDQIKEIKTVKNAKIYFDSGIIYCQHYQTIIFAWDEKNQVCEIQRDLSLTSNRQIKYLIDAYKIKAEQIQNVSKFERWEFRASL